MAKKEFWFSYTGVGIAIGAAVLAFLVYRSRSLSLTDSSATALDSSVEASSEAVSEVKKPLTIRSNNPGAIMGTDGKIVVYATADKGVEAMMKLLKSYVDRGYNTITKIISRWAPSSAGNNTNSYISFVSSRSGIQQDTLIDVSNRVNYLPRIAYYMHIMEAGYAWLDISVFERISRTLM
jgi:hypothetical protein